MSVPTIDNLYVSPEKYKNLPRYKESSLARDSQRTYTYPCPCVVFIDPCRLVNVITRYYADPADPTGTTTRRLLAIQNADDRHALRNAKKDVLNRVMATKRARVDVETGAIYDHFCTELGLEPEEPQGVVGYPPSESQSDDSVSQGVTTITI